MCWADVKCVVKPCVEELFQQRTGFNTHSEAVSLYSRVQSGLFFWGGEACSLKHGSEPAALTCGMENLSSSQ